MKEFLYTVKSEGFEGCVEIARPSFSQRMKYVAECSFEFVEGKDGNQTIQMNSKNADAIGKMVEYAEKHIKTIDITHLASGEKATSFEDLCYNNIYDSVLVEIASAIMSGANLGGKKGQG